MLPVNLYWYEADLKQYYFSVEDARQLRVGLVRYLREVCSRVTSYDASESTQYVVLAATGELDCAAEIAPRMESALKFKHRGPVDVLLGWLEQHLDKLPVSEKQRIKPLLMRIREISLYESFWIYDRCERILKKIDGIPLKPHVQLCLGRVFLATEPVVIEFASGF